MATVPPPSSSTAPKKRRGGCRGCLKWLGILILLFLIIVGIVAALFFRVPQSLGLMSNAAKKYLVATPDRAGAEELLRQAQARGLSARGVHLYVLPYKDGNGSVASVVMDSREGFSFGQGGGLKSVASVFSQIAGSAKADELGIKYVTATYVSPKGQDLMSLSASRADALSFAGGGMSDTEFMSKLNGDINLPAVIGEQIESLQRMSQ